MLRWCPVSNDIITVTKDPMAIKWIKKPSLEVQMAAVAEKVYAIEFIRYPHQAVQLMAINKSPNIFPKIRNPSPEAMIHACSLEGDNIKHILKPTQEMKIAAVTHKTNAMRHIKEQNEELQLTAIANCKDEWFDFWSFKNPSKRVRLAAITKCPRSIGCIRFPSKEEQLVVMNISPGQFSAIEKPCVEK